LKTKSLTSQSLQWTAKHRYQRRKKRHT